MYGTAGSQTVATSPLHTSTDFSDRSASACHESDLGASNVVGSSAYTHKRCRLSELSIWAPG